MNEVSKNSDYYAAQSRMELLPNYYQWIYKLIAKYLKKRIADLGCGKGFMLKLMHEQGDYDLLLGIDASLENINNNALNNVESEKVVLLHRDLDNCSFDNLVNYKVDTTILLDVLEHIRDDKTLLATIYQILPERGRLIVKVPAVRWLYGSIDVASQHFIRYSRKELKNKAESIGFKTLKVKYMNFLGGLCYLVNNKILKKTTNFSCTFTPKKLKRLNNLMPCLQFIDMLIPCSFGLSLIGVFEK